ncbi:hypothetical protein GOQ30_18395 [Flavobacterium sp. TP390]|uniref:Uncharacterized protein n=1 Tax=Flavobacterium profundi TaxID=1774945 RepID=A0A6I4IW78_9FLAO|nr:hypothetical protein [Flavobacterium profundi]MVO11141.1 hypothetical protein [Flavobacterium profundi]
MNKTIRPIIALTIFAILFILLFPISILTGSLDFASSVIPGWHTTVYPPFFVWGIVKMIVLTAVVFGYWKLYRKEHRINKFWFILHFLLTIPSVIDTLFPISPMIIVYNYEKLFETMERAQQIILVLNSMFIAGQILFIIYYFKAKAAANNRL